MVVSQGNLSSIVALAAVLCLSGGGTSAGAAGLQKVPAAMQAPSQKRCPSGEAMDLTLSNASAQMAQGQYASAAETLHPLAMLHCSPRVSLLYAAATEASGHAPEAEQILESAHTLWPA